MNDRSIMILVMMASMAAALAAAGTSASASAQATGNATTTENATATATENVTSVKITKHATNSYTITEGSAKVGSFDTVYLITGSASDIGEIRDLLTSTIRDDFNASSTIGYIVSQAAGNNTTTAGGNSTAATLPNPFASSEEVGQAVAGAIQKGVEAAQRSDQTDGEMICHFGMNLTDFECKFVPLLDVAQ